MCLIFVFLIVRIVYKLLLSFAIVNCVPFYHEFLRSTKGSEVTRRPKAVSSTYLLSLEAVTKLYVDRRGIRLRPARF